MFIGSYDRCDHDLADIVLGQGAYGKVMRAEATGIDGTSETSQVAVKMVRGEFFPTICFCSLSSDIS